MLAVPGDYLSLGIMIVQSNDKFLAPSDRGIALFNGSTPVSGDYSNALLVWDAGTEQDQQPGSGSGQPLQGNDNTGLTTTAPVLAIADGSADAGGFTYPAAASVMSLTITPVDSVSVPVTVSNVSDPLVTGLNPYPLAGAAWAITDGPGSPLFDAESPDAGRGMEALAEDSSDAALVAWLADAPAAYGIQSSGSFRSGPMLSGQQSSFTVQAEPGDYFHFASMLVQSNDKFYAPAAGIPLFDTNGFMRTGDATMYLQLWDAGTEVDQTPGSGAGQPLQGNDDSGLDQNLPVRLLAYGQADSGGFTYPNTNTVIRVELNATSVDPLPAPEAQAPEVEALEPPSANG